jgi:hypothetical protein
MVVGLAAVGALGLGAPAAAQEAPRASAGWRWWEAENPRATNFPDRNPFAPPDAQGAAALSGGKWIGASDPDRTLFAEYDVSVDERASYQFYARKFWLHGPFRWRFDQQAWRSSGRDVVLLDSVGIAPFVGANWVHLGGVALTRGKHVLRIELLETKGAAAFDCFLLTTVPFVARGKLRPGEKVGVAPEGWFAFEPDYDPLAPSAPAALDLRGLNEAHAGDGGFIQARGPSFVHGKSGRPVRFWAIDAGSAVLNHDRPGLDRLARFLAKFGVNLVRFHGPLWKDDDVTQLDPAKLDRVHALLAALKAQGIYLELSLYFPLWMQPKDGAAFAGYDGQQHPFALPFFSPAFQQLQKNWWRAVLTTTNPYTGLPLRKDPALAFIEILNEDSILFSTFEPYRTVPAAQMKILETRFGDWLERRHGPLERTFARWGGARITGDDESAGRAGLMALSDLTRRRDARAQDTATFLAELQRTYYDEMFRFLKQDLDFKGSVTGSNWITADARTLGPLDKWSNAGCDFMDRHGYFGGPHQGARAAYSIEPGDRYDDALALRFETGKDSQLSFELPIMDLAYNGKPSTISEINWVPPNRYRTDMPILAAAYGALQGSDAFIFFAGGDSAWDQQLDKFSITDPAAMGQFPAAALLFRNGLVKTAEPVVHLEIDLASLQALQGLPLAAPQNLDALRAEGILPRKPSAATLHGAPARKTIDPLAYLVGPVEVHVSQAPTAVSRAADLSSFIDRRARTVRSATGELLWDWGRGLATIDAPAAQGATGLLRQAGAISLGSITIAADNEYGAVLLVALDGAPLAGSRKMLLQVMSEDSNTGWSAPGRGLRAIAAVGGPPLIVKKLAGRVTFKRGDARALRVTALDANGYPLRDRLALTAASDLALRPDTFYYLIEK